MDEFWLEESSQGSFEAFNDFMRGEPGPYFTPRVDANGNLIWTNNGDLPNPETVNIKGPKGNTGNNGQNGKSAYQQAVEGGYRGSEGSFNDYMANFPAMASAAQTAASQASTAAGQAAASAAHAEELVDTLPDDYEDLLQDTAKTIQAVESTTVGPASIATFDASADNMPLKGLTVDIEPVQDLHGYDNPWPAGGGKNLWNPEWVINGYISSASYDIISDSVAKTVYVPVEEGVTYTVSKTGGTRFRYAFASEKPKTSTHCFDFGQKDTATSITVIAPTGATYLAAYVASSSDNNAQTILASVQIEVGSTATAYSPYSNICPITGWTGCKLHRTGVSLIGGDAFLGYAFAKTDSGYELTYGGSGVSQRSSAYADITGLPAGRYTLQFINYTCPDRDAVTFRFRSPGGSWTTLTIIGGAAFGRRTFTMPANASQIQFYFSPNTASVGDKLTADDVVLMREEDGETPEPYKGNTYDITFPTEAGTVYGGTLDVVGGKLSVEYASRTLPNADSIRDSTVAGTGKFVRYNMSRNTSVDDDTVNAIGEKLKGVNRSSTEYRAAWTMQTYFGNTNAYLSVFVPADYTLEQIDAAIAGSQIVYKLTPPIVYDLIDIPEITTLLGENNIWAETGDVTATYGAYLEMLKASLDRTNSDLANLRACIAPTEDGDAASQTYVQGAYFFRNGSFCVALLEISSGNQFTLGTNYKVVSVAEAILAMSFVILEQPVDSKTAVNDMATFTVNARGVQSYQWQYWTPSSTNWNDNTGDVSHQPTFSIQATTARYNYKYHCKLTSYDGTVIYTNEVKIVQPS